MHEARAAIARNQSESDDRRLARPQVSAAAQCLQEPIMSTIMVATINRSVNTKGKAHGQKFTDRGFCWRAATGLQREWAEVVIFPANEKSSVECGFGEGTQICGFDVGHDCVPKDTS